MGSIRVGRWVMMGRWRAEVLPTVLAHKETRYGIRFEMEKSEWDESAGAMVVFLLMSVAPKQAVATSLPQRDGSR